MTQFAIGYGRKSFDDPDHRTSSVDDQQVFAQAYARQHGMELIAFHSDDGITGATMERPALQTALAALKAGKAKILIIEDVDRLGRDQEHLSYMRKLFAVHDVVLHTVAAGRIDDLTFAFKGIIGEQQRARIAYTTRRGLKGKATRGGSTGGKTLGYVRQVLGLDAAGRPTDCLAICEEEAVQVLRIFRLYADGYSLKGICKILNEEGVPSPRARERGKYNSGIWNPTTLSGNPALGEGILNNEMYIGRRIFNRRKWVEIPNDNRGFTRVPRLNPESEWIVRDEPDLRIIDQSLWDQVKARQSEARMARDVKFGITGNPLGGAKRPMHFLSGLVHCGLCGQPFVSVGPRWRCKAAARQACENSSIAGAHLEDRALAGLRDKLLTPEIISRFAVHLQRELDDQMRVAHGRRDEMEASLAETRRRIAKLVKQMEEEDDLPRSVMTRLKDLEREEERLEKELTNLPERTVVRLPANYETINRSAIADLDRHLTMREASASRNAIRVLIEGIVVHGGDSRGGKHRRLELRGDLFSMLEFAEAAVNNGNSVAQNARKSHQGTSGTLSRTSLVAGAGFEPATFRL